MNEELRQAPNLRATQKENPFTLPDNYFDKLHELILKKTIHHSTQPKSTIVSLLLTPKVAIAASFALLFSIGLIFYNTLQTTFLSDDQGELELEYFMEANPLFIQNTDECLILSEFFDNEPELSDFSIYPTLNGISDGRDRIVNLGNLSAEDLLNYVINDPELIEFHL